ncbi:TRAP transporter small permease [Pseudosulfitobacter pseudonitzschiae]|nr:TRAP transporter small permease [Pseudosulfitobacter pseudonitzschiae]
MRLRRKLQNTIPDRIAGKASARTEMLRADRSAWARIGRGVTLMLDVLAVFSMTSIGAAGVLTCVDIVLRHMTDMSIRGVIELTQLAMMYSVFAAIAYAFGKRAHVAVTVLTDLMPERVGRTFAILGWLGGIVLLGWLVVASFDQARLVAQYGDVSQNLKIPMIIYWLSVIVGLALSACGSLWAILQDWHEGVENER